MTEKHSFWESGKKVEEVSHIPVIFVGYTSAFPTFMEINGSTIEDAEDEILSGRIVTAMKHQIAFLDNRAISSFSHMNCMCKYGGQHLIAVIFIYPMANCFILK